MRNSAADADQSAHEDKDAQDAVQSRYYALNWGDEGEKVACQQKILAYENFLHSRSARHALLCMGPNQEPPDSDAWDRKVMLMTALKSLNAAALHLVSINVNNSQTATGSLRQICSMTASMGRNCPKPSRISCGRQRSCSAACQG